MSSHRPLSSSFLGLLYRLLNINHKKELRRGLWVAPCFGDMMFPLLRTLLSRRFPKPLKP